MKKLLLLLCLIMFSSYAFAQEPVVLEEEKMQEEIQVEQSINIIKEILDTDLDNVFYEIEISDEEEYLEEETITQNAEENVENVAKPDDVVIQEDKVIDAETVFFDINSYNPENDGQIFKLKIESNEELLKFDREEEFLKFSTDYTDTTVAKSKFNNKTTISSKTMRYLDIKGQSVSVGYGSDIKEYLPLPDTNNFSVLTNTLYANYNTKHVTFESSFSQNKNIVTDKINALVSFGPKINLTKSAYIKGGVTKNLNSQILYNELSFVYTPIKSKRDLYFEINSLYSNTQYNVPQRTLQFMSKFKI
ncbi:hypothetical protein J6Q66_05515 [bacterium]|nr:hypothetical protein [bacterium]